MYVCIYVSIYKYMYYVYYILHIYIFSCFNTSCISVPFISVFSNSVSAGIYLFKAKNGNTRTKCEICSNLAMKTPERRQ